MREGRLSGGTKYPCVYFTISKRHRLFFQNLSHLRRRPKAKGERGPGLERCMSILGALG